MTTESAAFEPTSPPGPLSASSSLESSSLRSANLLRPSRSAPRPPPCCCCCCRSARCSPLWEDSGSDAREGRESESPPIRGPPRTRGSHATGRSSVSACLRPLVPLVGGSPEAASEAEEAAGHAKGSADGEGLSAFPTVPARGPPGRRDLSSEGLSAGLLRDCGSASLGPASCSMDASLPVCLTGSMEAERASAASSTPSGSPARQRVTDDIAVPQPLASARGSIA